MNPAGAKMMTLFALQALNSCCAILCEILEMQLHTLRESATRHTAFADDRTRCEDVFRIPVCHSAEAK